MQEPGFVKVRPKSKQKGLPWGEDGVLGRVRKEKEESMTSANQAGGRLNCPHQICSNSHLAA
jgi:hypothetical protein